MSILYADPSLTQDDIPSGTTYKQFSPAAVAITGGSAAALALSGTCTVNGQPATAMPSAAQLAVLAEQVPLAPIAHWPFNDGAGSPVLDVSSGVNHGVLQNSGGVRPAWQNTLHQAGASLLFDGTGGYVYMQQNAAYSTYVHGTVSFWFRQTSANSAFVCPFSWSGSYSEPAADWFVIGIDNNHKVRVSIVDHSGASIIEVHGGSTIALDTWYHVCVTMGATGMVMYLNAVAETLTWAVGNSSTVAWFNTVSPTSATLVIGCMVYVAAVQNFFPGNIADVAIYSGALSAANVKKLFQTGFCPS